MRLVAGLLAIGLVAKQTGYFLYLLLLSRPPPKHSSATGNSGAVGDILINRCADIFRQFKHLLTVVRGYNSGRGSYRSCNRVGLLETTESAG